MQTHQSNYHNNFSLVIIIIIKVCVEIIIETMFNVSNNKHIKHACNNNYYAGVTLIL